MSKRGETALAQTLRGPVFTVLGPVRAWRDGVELDLGPPRRRAMLAVLLARTGGPVSLGEIADVLWGADPPSYATNIIHQYVGALRRLLEPDLPARAAGRWLVRSAGGYRLEVDAESLDLLRFRRLRGQARGCVDGDPREAVALLTEALQLWRGPAAIGIDPPVRQHPLFVGLDRERLAAARDTADAALRAGVAERVVGVVQEVAEQAPLDEPLQARLMLALAAAGRQAEALDVYQAVRARLAADLGVDPGPELGAAHRKVLRRQADDDTVDTVDTVDTAHATAGPPVAAAGPAQLPADLAAFTGRREELKQVLALLGDDDRVPPTVVISIIGGMAGVGKTTLAVHWAHRVADRFPDGQLYVNLRGFGPGGSGGSAMGSTEALRGFLEALGVPPQRVPASLDGQEGLYRSLLAGRRVLVLLDNARSVEQVRPLLPGSPGCLVIITSRDRLSGLIAGDGANPLTLQPLPGAEARDFLARRLGAGRVAAEPEAVEEIVRLCMGLPLTLAIVAARAATHHWFPLSAFGAELREGHGTLDGFPGVEVRAVFSWSYGALTPDAARLFRLLGLHPGPDIGAPAAASLAGSPAARARPLLAELTRAHLLMENAPGRYSLHDLLRAYAIELVHDDERGPALLRLMDHYLHSGHAAALLLSPSRESISVAEPQPGVIVGAFDDQAEAMAWFTTEHHTLLAVVEQAAGSGMDGHPWQLAWTMDHVLQRRGTWHELAIVHRTALHAAQRGGDRCGQAQAHRGLAGAYSLLGRYDDAHRHLGQALTLFVELGDLTGEANVHDNLGWLLNRQGLPREALAHYWKALDRFQVSGKAENGYQLNRIGWTHAMLGEYRQTLVHSGQALTIFQGLGDRHGEAEAWDNLGYAHHHLGEHPEAIACCRQALELYRILGDRYFEAEVLDHLGETHRALGEVDAARPLWRQALDILTELDLPEADQIRDKLRLLDHPAAEAP